MDHVLRRFPLNLLPILTCKINARACDCAVEGKCGAGGFIEYRKKDGGDNVGGRCARITSPGEVISSKESHSHGTV